MIRWTTARAALELRIMYKEGFENETADKGDIFKPASDTFMAAVPWTKNRTVVVFRRERNGREYVRCRTFNRHRTKKVWYPAPRFYMVPVGCAEDLGKAIIAAAKSEPRDPPGWWYDFDKQYQAGEWRRKPEFENEPDDDLDEWVVPPPPPPPRGRLR